MGTIVGVYLDWSVAKDLEDLSKKHFKDNRSLTVTTAILALKDMVRRGYVPQVTVEKKADFELKWGRTPEP